MCFPCALKFLLPRNAWYNLLEAELTAIRKSSSSACNTLKQHQTTKTARLSSCDGSDKESHISTCHDIRTVISERTDILRVLKSAISWAAAWMNEKGSSFMPQRSSIISSKANKVHNCEQSLLMVQPLPSAGTVCWSRSQQPAWTPGNDRSD